MFWLLLLSADVILAQSPSYSAYQTSFAYVSSCPSDQYYDIALLQCSPCPANAVQKPNDPTQCDCVSKSFYYGVNQGGGSLLCLLCPSTYTRSSDGFGCVTAVVPCDATVTNVVLAESNLDGSLNGGSASASSAQPRVGDETCISCQSGTGPDSDSQRCTPCASITPRPGIPTGPIDCCTASSKKGGVCLRYLASLLPSYTPPNNQNRFKNPTLSVFFQENLEASIYLCRMNLNPTTTTSSTRTLLSNATACQVLANIAAMQFYFGDNQYAYYYYDTYIWTSTTTLALWTVASIRTSIPFLTYPTTYYEEVSSSSYNWVPSAFTQNDIVDIKLAKYSVNGQFLGLVDAIDTHMQLCGGGYTDGRPAFTFGAPYKKACTIRADALWNSPLYETAFFDPYVQFTRAGSDFLLPSPVVIVNYQGQSSSTPNKNSDESKWTYHRRFFLLDRVSGVSSNNELKNVHYAKSIKILHTLTTGASSILPPVIVVEYDELSASDIGKGTLIEVTFETQYRMNLDTHIRDIWIATGVLAVAGILLAFFRTTGWQSRSGKYVIDLGTIGKLLLYICNILAAVFFVVMAGVSIWWLIFFKRQDALYLVLPTDAQSASFTALVVVAFALKTIDILHLVVRQSNVDIFFIDWEKPKAGSANSVSVWRSYFVANEFNEIQTFRRISLTFQLFFVLFLLKVINLANVANTQPGVNLFPSASDYTADSNGILRVGIAFSMWLATGIVQYLVYVAFYQRFVEDKLLNFIDLCSVSNISVFMLLYDHYGYYIHGRSPHGNTDVNMKEMLMNLERESNQTVGTRGLQPKSKEQTFIMKIDRSFRSQYELLLRSYQNRILTRATKKSDEHESEILMNSYRNLNDFLCAFINQSLPNYHYAVVNRLLLEKIFDYEFRSGYPTGPQGQVESIFFVDTEKNFSKVIFAGYEKSLFLWNMITFLFMLYFVPNYVLAAVVTYLLNMIATSMRSSLGRKNLAAKTLIPKNFLI